MSRTEELVDMPFLLRFRPLRVTPVTARFDMMEARRENALRYVSKVVDLVHRCRDLPALFKDGMIPWLTSWYIARVIGVWEGWGERSGKGESSKYKIDSTIV